MIKAGQDQFQEESSTKKKGLTGEAVAQSSPTASDGESATDKLVVILDSSPSSLSRDLRASSVAPEGVSPALFTFFLRTKLTLDEGEHYLLWPFVIRLIGSGLDLRAEGRRAYRLVDWTVRQVTPLAIRAVGLEKEAEALCRREPIIDSSTARACNSEKVLGNLDLEPTSEAEAAAIMTSHNAARSVKAAAFSLSHFGIGSAFYADAAVTAARGAGADQRALIQMRLSLLDELCPSPINRRSS